MKLLLPLALILFLSACSTISPSNMPAPGAASMGSDTSSDPRNMKWEQRQTQLSRVHDWRIKGAMAVKVSDRNGFNASFNWQQRDNDYDLQIFGPLGANSVSLSGSPNKVQLITSDNKIYTAADPESLLKQRMGWQLPVSDLYYWIRALPAPGSQSRASFDSMNHVVRLQQQGWQIEYSDYRSYNHVDLPGRVTLISPSMRIRIVINQWNVATA